MSSLSSGIVHVQDGVWRVDVEVARDPVTGAMRAAIARPGSTVGIVGVPHGVEIPFMGAFFRNVGWHGGPAPARIYIPELLDDVLEGRINPGRVFDDETKLDDITQAYTAMDERRAIKSLLRIGSV